MVLLVVYTEVNYMDPENLEFADEPHNCSIKEDRTVQYADLADRTVQYADSPKYINIV